MKKKSLVLAIGLLIGCQISINAEIPNGSAVIGKRAFSLEYTNRKENKAEIIKEIKNCKGNIYIKSFEGEWKHNLSEKKVIKSMIPSVTYKNKEGKVFHYEAEDGEEIKLDIESVKVINSKEFIISFNKEMDKESLLNKSSYKIQNKPLIDKDSISIIDSKSISIILHEKVELKNKSIELEICNDVNMKAYIYSAHKDCVIENINIEGAIIVNSTIDSPIYLNNVIADKIIMLSEFDNNIYLKNVKTKELEISSEKAKIHLKDSVVENFIAKTNINLKVDKASKVINITKNENKVNINENDVVKETGAIWIPQITEKKECRYNVAFKLSFEGAPTYDLKVTNENGDCIKRCVLYYDDLEIASDVDGDGIIRPLTIFLGSDVDKSKLKIKKDGKEIKLNGII